ncbi:MAG: hypothetical protein JSV84_14620 [Gemmatimonadota bacterium]|nr:MAG: hypothetical protein JSV84_14620 [Gemmatimonadota bacterium]
MEGSDSTDVIINFVPGFFSDTPPFPSDSGWLTIFSNDPDEEVLHVHLHGSRFYWGLRGDVNGDGNINILDALVVINHILGTNFITDSAAQ